MKLNDIVFGTILSILTFFSVSFLFVIYRISPITMGDTYKLEIGFPYEYYHQFLLSGNPFLNSGWNINNLLIDCFIYWVTIAGLYLIYKAKTRKN